MFTGESLDSSVISCSFAFFVACPYSSSRSLSLLSTSDSQSFNDLAFSLLSLIALFLYWLLIGFFLKSWAVASRCSFSLSFLEDEVLSVLKFETSLLFYSWSLLLGSETTNFWNLLFSTYFFSSYYSFTLSSTCLRRSLKFCKKFTISISLSRSSRPFSKSL